MLRNYIAPGAFPEEFLLQDGKSRSIATVESYRDKIEGITGSIHGFKYSDIHWLSREVNYNMTWNWHDKSASKEEQVRLNTLQENLLAGAESEAVIPSSLELVDFIKTLVLKYGDIFYKKMLSFDAGEKEDDCGNNRMYQSGRLGECILLGIRLGIDIAVIETWKQKLKNEDSKYISENIFPTEER